jgi:stage IV sporulation protein FB
MLLLSSPPPTRYDLRFSLLGIPVRVHPLFWVMTALLGATSGTVVGMLIWVPAVFVSILVHELGHGLTMRRFGQVPKIEMHLGGGSTAAEPFWWGSRPVSVPLTPGQDVLIALAGPSAGFLLAALAMGIVAAAGGEVGVTLAGGVLPLPFAVFSANLWIATLTVNTLLWVNVFWGLINLAPVVPLDGGNIARTLLIRSDPWKGARNALRLSAAAGAVIAVACLILLGSPLIALLFGFMAFQSWQSLQGNAGGGFY